MENSNEGKGLSNVRKIVPIPSAGKFFRAWLEALKPLHHLTDRETDLLAAFLVKRHELQRTILDPSMVDTLLMSSNSKKAIRKSVNISSAYFQRIMAKYRKNGVLIEDPNIKGGRIHPNYIPVLKEEDKSIGLMFVFLNPNDD